MQWRFVPAENNGVMSTIPNKPVPLKSFVKHCDQRRKFPVLYKVEFQVNFSTLQYFMLAILQRILTFDCSCNNCSKELRVETVTLQLCILKTGLLGRSILVGHQLNIDSKHIRGLLCEETPSARKP